MLKSNLFFSGRHNHLAQQYSLLDNESKPTCKKFLYPVHSYFITVLFTRALDDV